MKYVFLIPVFTIIITTLASPVAFAQSNPLYDDCMSNPLIVDKESCERYRMIPGGENQPQNNQGGGDTPDVPPTNQRGDSPNETPSDRRGDTPDVNPTEQSTSNPTSDRLNNPLAGSGITTVDGLLRALLDILVIIATPIVVIFIILSGFKYVTAQGDTSKLEEAKRALVYAIIGGVLIIGASVIADIIAGTVNSFR